MARLAPDLAPHGPLAELLIDRGYLGSPEIGALHARGVAIRAKAWTSTNGAGFRSRRLRSTSPRRASPVPRSRPRRSPGAPDRALRRRRLPALLAPRALHDRPRRRSVAIHPQEALLQSLRAYQQQPEGRTRLRQRTTIEHSLARVNHIQGPKARYKGIRKNTLDVRRVAVVANLQRIARLRKAA